MRFYIKHSLPGRIRVGFDKTEVTPKQASLAQTLLSVQEGITQVTVNYVTGAFLIYYDTALQSLKSIEALFMALSKKYLDDEEMLASVDAPAKQQSLLEALALMTAQHYLRRLLPAPVRFALNVLHLTPRVTKGALHVAQGDVFHPAVLDATAIAASALMGDMTTASNINFLLDMGETIEEFTKRKSYDNLALTMLSDRDNVQLVEDTTEKSVPLYLIRSGDVVAVRTGALVPADGEVLSGEALVNQATITGEPLAVEKRAGATVFAGTVVQEGEIFVRVRAVGSQTKVQNILAMIDSSQGLKVSSQIRSERLATQLVKANFLLSALTFLFTGGNITKVMATLMVDYSCAMKLAAPIAVLSAMKEAAEQGIAVKGGKFLEDASRADVVVFDKTGTLTAAKPCLSRIIPFKNHDENVLLMTAACLEEHFAHPVAHAIVQASEARHLQHPEEHAKVEYVVAHGIATELNGKRLLIGSKHFIFEDEAVRMPEGLAAIQQEALRRGESLLYLAEDGELLGAFAINDPVREDAAEIIARLHQNGVKKCVMITGDDEGAARTAAEATGVDEYLANALPEDKVAYITREQKCGRKVIMIGDGINDAPALAAADTGIAMGDSAAITGEAADIVLASEDGLGGLLTARLLGQKLLERIDENNYGIVAVNSALIAAGLFGRISPSVAAVLHNSSTIAFSYLASKPLLR